MSSFVSPPIHQVLAVAKPGGAAGQYVVRAASLDQEQIGRHAAALKRLLAYAPPSDAPATADSGLPDGPRRLIFRPADDGGPQMLAHVVPAAGASGEGRAGRGAPFVAHVLLCEPTHAARPWTALDGLELWNAPGWITEPPPDDGLPALTSLGQLGHHPPVNDDVLLGFLHPHRDFLSHDAELIPPRWHEMDAEDRRSLFRTAMCGYLQLAADGDCDDALLLVVEPSLAVLLFYGIARLLPAGWRSRLSFCTYEPNPDVPSARLAATCFADPQNDLRGPRYRKGFVLNTFTGNSTPLKWHCPWAEVALQALITKGPEAVDRLLAAFDEAGVERVEDLNLLAEAETTLRQAFSPPSPIAHHRWWQSELKTRYLRQAARQRLADPLPLSALDELVNSPEHLLTVLELAAGADAPPACREKIDHLVRRLPASQFREFLDLASVDARYKLDALHRYVTGFQSLPEHCAELWTKPALADLPVPLLSRLDGMTLAGLWQSLPAESRGPFAAQLLRTSAQTDVPPDVLRQMIEGLDEAKLSTLLRNEADALARVSPSARTALADRLQGILDALLGKPGEVRFRLTLLDRGRELLPEEAQRRLAAWQRFRDRLAEVRARTTSETHAAEAEDAAYLSAAARQALGGAEADGGRAAARVSRQVRQVAAALEHEVELPAGWRAGGATGHTADGVAEQRDRRRIVRLVAGSCTAAALLGAIVWALSDAGDDAEGPNVAAARAAADGPDANSTAPAVSDRTRQDQGPAVARPGPSEDPTGTDADPVESPPLLPPLPETPAEKPPAEPPANPAPRVEAPPPLQQDAVVAEPPLERIPHPPPGERKEQFTLAAAAEDTEIVVHGLDRMDRLGANLRLADNSVLIRQGDPRQEDRRASGVDVLVDLALPSGRPARRLRLASLFIARGGLQCAMTWDAEPELRRLQAELRSCVVELRHGSARRFVALAPPVRVRSPASEGAVLYALQIPVTGSLYLGAGRLRTATSEYPFGTPIRRAAAVASIAMPELASDYSLQRAALGVAAVRDGRAVRLALQTSPAAAELAEQRNEALKPLEELHARFTMLVGDATAAGAERDERLEAYRRLAEALEVEIVPKTQFNERTQQEEPIPGYFRSPEFEAWTQRRLVAPGRRYLQKLQAEIERVTQVWDEDIAALERPRQEVQAIEAEVYRLLQCGGTEVRVPVVLPPR